MKNHLTINPQTCTGCGGCLAACPFGALSLKGGIAVVEPELCCLCGACIKACPYAAIAIADDSMAPAQGLGDFRNIWVFAEHSGGQLHDSALELLTAGRILAIQRGCLVEAVVFGPEGGAMAATLIAAGADRVYVITDPLLKVYEASLYADALAQLIDRHKPEVVLAAATAVGRGFFAKTAVKACTGLTADCTALAIDSESGLLEQTRPAFGGNIMAEIITPNHRPQMATVRPGVFKKGVADPNRIGETLLQTLTLAAPATRIVKSMRVANRINLVDAEIIVAGGRGLKKRENFKLLYQLADILGGVVAATRACVDAGWIPAAHQVGQTGKTVSPRIYLAFGISGAIQHLEGMRSSDCIIAVNNDPNAPIFEHADLCIIGDLFEIIPELILALA